MFLTSGYIFTGSILPCEIISRGKFELDCFRQMKVQMIQNIELSSTMVEPDVPTGRPTQEPEVFEEALKDANWKKNLSLEDQDMLKEVVYQFPMFFAHVSHLLGDANNEEFDICLNVTEDNYPKTFQKKRHMHTALQKRKILRTTSKSCWSWEFWKKWIIHPATQ